jgi:hypothetical protein
LILEKEKIVSVNENSDSVPEAHYLLTNYPNPFNASTIIEYTIPNSIVKEQLVNLRIYDILGREIANLVNEFQKSGTYKANWNAAGFSSGIYFYTLSAGELSITNKTILLK